MTGDDLGSFGLMLSFVCSGLESSAVGFGCEAMGKISRHKQCEEHDDFELLLGSDGHSLPAVRSLAKCTALLAYDLSGQIWGEI